MRKRWFLIINLIVCILLLAFLWQNVSACWLDIEDDDYCNQENSCDYASAGRWFLEEFDGGNWCRCQPYGGTKAWCDYIEWGGTCLEYTYCTDSGCDSCNPKKAVSERSCVTPD